MRSSVPFGVLAFALIVTVGLTLYVSHTITSEDSLRFRAVADEAQNAIEARINLYIAMLRSGRALFSVDGDIDRENFRRYVERLDLRARYPGVQGFGFSAVVPADRVDAMTRKMRLEGMPDFHIWPMGGREEYHTIVYLEPLDERNKAAIGFDMYSEPTRRLAMARARDTGNAAASGKVTLKQEIDRNKQAGFLIYMPVYSGAKIPESVVERRKRLVGFVYSPFRADDLLAGILNRQNLNRIDFHVFDGDRENPDWLLHDSGSLRGAASTEATVRYMERRTIDVAGRKWMLIFRARPNFVHSSGRHFVGMTLVGGILTSLILFVITSAQVRARFDAETIAEDLRRSEKRLREESDTLEAVNRIDRILSAQLDLNKLLSNVTEAARQLTRAEFGLLFFRSAGGSEYSLWATAGLGEWRAQPRLDDALVPILADAASKRISDIEEIPELADLPVIRALPQNVLPLRSLMVVPVVARSQDIVGWMLFGHSSRGCFSARDQKVLEGLAAQAAIGIDNARLYESARLDRWEAEAANRSKDEFLATLSHELRTPMTAILGWTRMLEIGQLDERTEKEALDAIRRSSQAQAQLIDDLLDVSRIAAGKLELEIKPVDLNAVVEEAVAAVRPAAEAREISLEVVTSGEPVQVAGDHSRLQQVAWNLLSNAVKFEKPGGLVRVSLGVDGLAAVLSVEDHGEGIDPEFLPHLFERFRQADAGSTRLRGGLGLGLSIVKHLTELHGGVVEAFSGGRNRGACFTIRLPLLGDDGSETTRAGRRKRSGADVLPALDGLKVLVVDDEATVRQFLATLIASRHAAVRQAESAEQALSIAREWDPHVVVSDIAMPAVDGFDLLRSLRAGEGRDPDVPVLALTAYARPEDRVRILAAGFQHYLRKPVEPLELLEAVATLAGRSV